MIDISYLMKSYYDLWVSILQILGGNPGKFGVGYYIANIILFVFVQPGLIWLFYTLWAQEKQKNADLEEGNG